jgi:hypothetical protein
MVLGGGVLVGMQAACTTTGLVLPGHSCCQARWVGVSINRLGGVWWRWCTGATPALPHLLPRKGGCQAGPIPGGGGWPGGHNVRQDDGAVGDVIALLELLQRQARHPAGGTSAQHTPHSSHTWWLAATGWATPYAAR